jgi:DnaJ family protein A protein 2
MSRPGNQKSLYDVLGVKNTDSCTEIKKAYLKLARTHHPDKGGDPERFKEIVRASEILADEKKRRMYDELGVTDDQVPESMSSANPFPGFPFPFDINMNLNDLFGNMFGNPQMGPQRGPIRKGKKPAPTIQTIPITLEKFYIGYNFDINTNRQTFCTKCDHSGAKRKEICKKCNGQGAVTQVVQMGPMAMHTTGPCLDCQGKGECILEMCSVCSGSGFLNEKRNLSVRILPGTRSQETYIFPEVCSDHVAFERPGDAHIILQEDPNDPAFTFFKRTGDQQQHLETTISLSLAESLIGSVVQLDGHPGYDEGLFLRIPPGSFHQDTYCLSGFGMPIPGNIGKYGDLYVKINVTIKPMERNLFVTKGAELLAPLFQDKIQTPSCPNESIQTDLYLHK